jgi:uracil-DNA glycosylase
LIEPYSPEEKSCPVFVEVSEHPIMIVGQNIGHETDGTHTGVVWEKNKSAQLLWAAIQNTPNLYLTNACNYTEMTDRYMEEGLYDLIDAIDSLKPLKIICLGNVAKDMVYRIPYAITDNIKFKFLVHPSYVLRINMNQEEYINQIKEALK